MKQHTILLAVISVITLVSVYFSVQLFKNVRTDFATMLPENDRSVRHSHYILDRVGGVGTLFITISSPDFQANADVVEAIAAEIKKLPKSLINDFQYNTLEIQNFYSDYGLYYMEIADLKKLRDLLYHRISQMRLKATNMLIDDTTSSDARQTEEILNKYKSKNPYAYFPEGYLGTEDGTILAIMIRPSGTTNDLEFSRKLVNTINGIIEKINPTSYHKSMEVGLTGTYFGLLENFNSIIKDAISTAGLTILLVILSIYFYYRNLRMLVILSFCILSGIAWTFAITFFNIGYLNQQTAFLGSIIIGNGINFGLIQMARYLEERTKGANVRRSVARSIIKTMSATGMAALTASMAYGVLSMTHFRGFSQFGFIGGIGMVLCWFASYLLAPLLLILFERFKPLNQKRLEKRKKHLLSGRLSQLVAGYHRQILLFLLLSLPLMLVIFFRYVSQDQFEYSVQKLGNKTALQPGHDLYNQRKLFKILKNSSSPAVLLAPTREKANEFANLKLKEIQEAKENGHPLSIGQVQWLDAIYPADQDKKAEIIRQMRKIFPEKYLSFLTGKEKKWASAAVRLISREPFKETDMPSVMLTGFMEKDKTLGRLVYFSASDKVNIGDISQLIRFGNDIENNLPLDSDEARLASQSLIFSDIVKDVASEGPVITILSYLLIGILVFFGSAKFRDFLFVYGFMTLGMIFYIATIELMGLKLNFLNFVVIPMTIGIGVDYGINIYYRYVLEGKGSVGHVITHTGGAVGLCSVTTMIGYGTMVIANNQSMVSFGLMAMIGELVILVSAMLFMTSLLEYRDKSLKKGFTPKKIMTTNIELDKLDNYTTKG